MIYSRRYRISLSGFVFLLPLVLAAAQIDSSLYPSIEGWKRSDTIKAFTPGNLYDFIDGAADAYLMQDFERLTVAYYSRGDSSVTVEIYRHRTEENAYGIYSQERTSDVELLPVGIEGYYAESVLNFVIGRTYVKLTSFTLGTRDKEVLTTVAKAVAGTIGGSMERPPLFLCFPEEGQIRKSDKFVGRDFLGYTYFRRGYLVDYRIDSTSFQMFLIQEADSSSCDSLISKYLRSIDRSPTGIGIMTVRDPYWGTIMIGRDGKKLIGLIGSVPNAVAVRLFDEFHTKITHIRKSQHEK